MWTVRESDSQLNFAKVVLYHLTNRPFTHSHRESNPNFLDENQMT